MNLSLQGHSIFTSSGEFGVGSCPGDPSLSGCLRDTGQNQSIYSSECPVNRPFIITVGEAQLYANQTVLDAESVMQDNLEPGYELFANADSLSNIFETPSYQKAALNAYFTTHDPGLPYYVASAMTQTSELTAVYINAQGEAYLTSGTSMAMR